MTQSLSEFYNNKQVLVTGHTGVKGAWLSRWLLDMGANVTGYALAPEADTANLYADTGLAGEMNSVIADLRDLDNLKDCLQQSRPEIVLHLAAQSLVRRSYRNPVETFATNTLGTAHILEAVRHTGSVQACVIVTTDKCYENLEISRPYREDDALGGHDPYSASKGAAEIVTSSMRRSFFNNDDSAWIASARAGNVIGGGDWSEDRLIPDLVRAVQSGAVLRIRNPNAIRPWQHLLEPLGGYLLLARNLCREGKDFAEAFNFGPAEQDCVSVRHVISKLQAIWPAAASLNIDINKTASDPHEAGLLKLDSTKASHRLGWQPQLTLDEALSWTAEWYDAYTSEPDRGRSLLSRQISAYMKKLDARTGP